MTEEIKYTLILTDLYVAPSGVIEGAELLVQTSGVLIEEGGVINLSEKGEDLKTGSGMSYLSKNISTEYFKILVTYLNIYC